MEHGNDMAGVLWSNLYCTTQTVSELWNGRGDCTWVLWLPECQYTHLLVQLAACWKNQKMEEWGLGAASFIGSPAQACRALVGITFLLTSFPRRLSFSLSLLCHVFSPSSNAPFPFSHFPCSSTLIKWLMKARCRRHDRWRAVVEARRHVCLTATATDRHAVVSGNGPLGP